MLQLQLTIAASEWVGGVDRPRFLFFWWTEKRTAMLDLKKTKTPLEMTGDFFIVQIFFLTLNSYITLYWGKIPHSKIIHLVITHICLMLFISSTLGESESPYHHYPTSSTSTFWWEKKLQESCDLLLKVQKSGENPPGMYKTL